jgi:predicted HAD superfamily hydrolase
MEGTYFTKNFEIPKNVKVISFDVFDTLLLRPFYKPTDLFSFLDPFAKRMMEKSGNFRDLRKNVEKAVREKSFPLEEITIDEIYDNFSHIPVKFRGAMKFFEMEMEHKLCFPRKSGQILYKKARESGLKVIAVSDIYFETPFLKKLLEKNGFYFDEIFSSASLRKRKKTGNIYPLVWEKMNVLPKEILHIGDNEISDIVKAKEKGLQTLHLPLLRNEIEKHPLYLTLANSKNCVLSSASISFLLEKLDEKGVEYFGDSLFQKNLYNLGFNAFGKILFAYLNWVLKKVQADGIKKIFFVARDGFIMHKAFDLLFKEKGIETHYLECSRKSLLTLAIDSKADVVKYYTKRFRNCTLQDFIEQKLECSPRKIEKHLKEIGFSSLKQKIKGVIYTKSQKKRLEKVVMFYSDEILKRLHGERPNTLKFIKNSGFSNGKIALCDVGYSGTTQKMLSKFNKEITGLYFMQNNEGARLENSFGFLTQNPSKFSFKILSSFVRLIESIVFSAPFGTVLSYDLKGNPVFENLKKIEGKRLEMNAKVWEGMIEFLAKIKSHFGAEMEFINYDKKVLTEIFLNFCFFPSKEDALLLKGVIFEDKTSAGGYQDIIENKLWKLGFLATEKPFLFRIFKPFIKIFLKCIKLIEK